MTRRAAVRAGAVVLALLGVVALVVHPARRTRAEARFTVPAPLVVGVAMGAILTNGAGATASAQGRSITVTWSDESREVARAHAEALARAALAGASQQVVAANTVRAKAATVARAQATAQLATLASRTGLTDPETAYRQRVALLQDLQQQRATALASGRPLEAIDAQLAEDQQAVFELQLQVTRHTELIAAQTTAARSERDATATIDAAKRALTFAPVQLSDHATGGGFGVAPGVALLVVAGVVLLFSELRAHRAAARTPGVESPVGPDPVVDRDDHALAASEATALESCGVRESRYLEFYRALGPTPEAALDPAPVAEPAAGAEPAPVAEPAAVDLVHEEAVEARGDLEEPAARGHDGSRP